MRSWAKVTAAVLVVMVAGVAAWFALSERSTAEPAREEGTLYYEGCYLPVDVDIDDPWASPGACLSPGPTTPPTEEDARAEAEDLARRGFDTTVPPDRDLPLGDPSDVADEDAGR